jgi:hypothetical protein
MANARRPHLQTPTRLSHPGRPGRGLQAPAHPLETAEAATGCKEKCGRFRACHRLISRAGRHSGWPCGCYLRTVRSMAAAFGFPLLGFLSPSAPVRLAACLHSTPPRVSNMLHAVGDLPTRKSPDPEA